MLWKMSAERMKCDKALTKWAMDWAASASCSQLPALPAPPSQAACGLKYAGEIAMKLLVVQMIAISE